MKIALITIIKFGIYLVLISGVYSSYTSLLNYIHKLHGSPHYIHAQLFFILNSISAILFNIIIPNIRDVNLKTLSYVAGIGFIINYSLTYFGFIIDNQVLMVFIVIISAGFAGLSSSIIGLLSGKYVNYTCQIYKQKQNQSKYYGIFGAMTASNFFMGAIISAISLLLVQQKNNLYLILIILVIIALIYCKFFVIDVQQINKQLQQSSLNNNQSIKYEQMHTAQSQQNNKFNVNKYFNKVCLFRNLSYYRKMLPLIPFQISNGLITGFIFHCTQDLVFSPDKSNKQKFLTINFIFIGIGCALGAFICGYISDKITYKKLFSIGTLMTLFSYFMSEISIYSQLQILSLFTALISGFTMFYTNNMLVIVCSKVYDGSLQAFATNRQMINISFILYNALINIIKNQDMHISMYYQLAILMLITLIVFYFVKFIKENNQNNIITQPNSNITEFKQQIQMSMDRSAKSSINQSNNHNQQFNSNNNTLANSYIIQSNQNNLNNKSNFKEQLII